MIQHSMYVREFYAKNNVSKVSLKMDNYYHITSKRSNELFVKSVYTLLLTLVNYVATFLIVIEINHA